MPTDTLIVLPTIGANIRRAVVVSEAISPLLLAGRANVASIMDEPTLAADDDEIAAYREAGDILDESPMRRGLVGAYRAGFAHFAAGSWSRLVLLEDALVLTDDRWFTALSRTLDAHPDFGWVACGQLENPNAPFTSLCSMLTRECALALDGGPDPLFAPCQFDDGDMMMRAMAAGFTPHAVDHKVSHPEARTSREGTEADDWALIEAHRITFMQRWGIGDFPWAMVPVHARCEQCA